MQNDQNIKVDEIAESSDRNKFLIEWYKILWNNARSSMDGVWKLIGPVTVVGAIWTAVMQGYLPMNLGYSLVFIILFWGMVVTIDFNQWHRRNLFFFTSVEREFLNEDDYGKLIPASFKKPKLEWISFYKICLGVFGSVLLISVIQALASIKKMVWCEQYHWLVLIMGFVVAVRYYRTQEKSTEKYYKELFGNSKK